MRKFKLFTTDFRGPAEFVEENAEIGGASFFEETIFTYRIDFDDYHKLDFKRTLDLMKKHGVSAAWFINYSKIPKRIVNKLIKEGQEVYIHCYKHEVYDDYQSNYDNLKKALEKHGEAPWPFGVCAPSGKWNPNYWKAVKDLGFKFGSDFSIAHDIPPFKIDGIWQIPITPVCVGSFIKKDPEKMKQYYFDLIEEKIANKQPLFLYGHPSKRIGKYAEILGAVFSRIKERGIKFKKWSEVYAALEKG